MDADLRGFRVVELKGWEERIDNLDKEIEEDLRYYSSVRKRARLSHRTLSIIVLIGSILAPVTVATGAVPESMATLGVLGIPADKISVLSLIITLVVALAEGLRRTFRFERRWLGAYAAGTALYNAQQEFKDSTVVVPIGDPDWVQAFQKLRASVLKAKSEEADEFFRVVTALDAKDPAVKKEPPTNSP